MNRSQSTVSVVIPCYNERATIGEILRRVAAQPLVTEIVAVDDGSRDGTREELARLEREIDLLRVILHERNRGKGAALRTGFAQARGDVVIVQDADLEYDPADYPALVRPIAEERAHVVYGSRYLRQAQDAGWHVVINRILTGLSNLVTRQHLTDMATCYKVFRTPLLRSLPLRQDRFGWDPEVTILVARRGVAIREVPIRYHPRTAAEGKKIGWKDGLRFLDVILRRGLLGM